MGTSCTSVRTCLNDRFIGGGYRVPPLTGLEQGLNLRPTLDGRSRRRTPPDRLRPPASPGPLSLLVRGQLPLGADPPHPPALPDSAPRLQEPAGLRPGPDAVVRVLFRDGGAPYRRLLVVPDPQTVWEAAPDHGHRHRRQRHRPGADVPGAVLRPPAPGLPGGPDLQ